MKYILILIAILSTNAMAADAFASKSAAATEVREQSIWDILRRKIESFTPRKKLVLASVSAGVRGSQADADGLYWAGESIEADPAEVDALRKALLLVDTDRAGAKRAMNEFLNAYPESGFAPYVHAALHGM